MFIVSILVFRPVPIVTEEKALAEKAVISFIFEAGTKDVVFLVEDNDRTFYINRGLELGLEMNVL